MPSYSAQPRLRGLRRRRLRAGDVVREPGRMRYSSHGSTFAPSPVDPTWGTVLSIGHAKGLPGDGFADDAMVRFGVTSAQLAGQTWNCGRFRSVDSVDAGFNEKDATAVLSLTAQEAQRPTAPPRCVVKRARVRRGSKLRLRCSHVTGRLVIRFHRGRRRWAWRRANALSASALAGAFPRPRCGSRQKPP